VRSLRTRASGESPRHAGRHLAIPVSHSTAKTRSLLLDPFLHSLRGVSRLYQRRWNVEPYHKSLKQNASLEKSPTQTVTSQTNHFFASLCGYIKLEMLKRSTKLNHFALKSKLYIRAVQVAFDSFQQL
jgi:hypothetical protein